MSPSDRSKVAVIQLNGINTYQKFGPNTLLRYKRANFNFLYNDISFLKIMQNLEKMVKELSERFPRENHEKRRLEVLKIFSHLYDKAATYVIIIMAIVYAGFFAVWSNMKVYMSTFDMRLSALCMGTSIFFFVMWEVIKMTITSSSLHKLQDVINASPDNLSAKLAIHQKEAAIIDVQVMKWWPVVLFFMTVTALIAANILVYSFMINL